MEKSRYGVFEEQEHNVEEGQQVKCCRLSLWSSVICDEISFFSYFRLKASGHTHTHTHDYILLTGVFGMINLSAYESV